MKISVITVTRNAVDRLEATLESVFSQQGVELESIVVDGASSDGTVDIITRFAAEHPDNMKWISRPDSGIYQALNRGIEMATGEVVGLLHAGDHFTSADVLAHVAVAFADPVVRMTYGDIHFVNRATGKVTRRYRSSKFARKPVLLKNGFAPPHPSLYMRRDLFAEVGPYKEDYRVGADFEYFVRLMLIKGIKGKYLPLDMVEMSTGGLSNRWGSRLWTNPKEKYRALRENNIHSNPFRLLIRYLYI